MKTVNVKGVDLSVLSLGTVQLGLNYGISNADGKPSQQTANAILDCAMARGINTLDTAGAYGDSEVVIGSWLRTVERSKRPFIVTKAANLDHSSLDALRRDLQNKVRSSKERLGVEQLDSLLLHRPDALTDPEEVASAVRTLKDAGKIRLFGVSNHNAGQISLLKRYLPGEIAINQMQFSLAHTPMVDAGMNVNMHSEHAVVKDGGTLDFCRLNDITIQAWSPFQHGMFEGVFLKSDKYPELNRVIDELAEKKSVAPSAIAVAWIMRHPAQIQTIVGTTNPDRLSDICAASSISISREEWYMLYLAAGNPLP